MTTTKVQPKSVAVPAPRAKRATSIAFQATLTDRGPTGMWPHLFLPPQASAWLGRPGPVNVIMTVDGVPFERIAKADGEGGHFIVFTAEMREKTGVELGDSVRVGLKVDPAPRTAEVPSELQQGLKDDPDARVAYNAMPPSHRKSYAEFIEDAKRPETRVRRVQQALRMIAQWGAEHAPKRGAKKR
ncbi:MAG: YdeI/OmpD-associated family protein [Candidatus Eisenbacteria bacterium]